MSAALLFAVVEPQRRAEVTMPTRTAWPAAVGLAIELRAAAAVEVPLTITACSGLTTLPRTEIVELSGGPELAGGGIARTSDLVTLLDSPTSASCGFAPEVFVFEVVVRGVSGAVELVAVPLGGMEGRTVGAEVVVAFGAAVEFL